MNSSLLIFLGLFTVLSGFAQKTNSVSPRDYTAFKIIPERNIFNPNRSARGSNVPRSEEKPAKIESFALVGTMSYQKGKFAFFDSSNSEFRKVLSPSKSIAGYTLTDVEESGVKLERDGKIIDLPVGSQMKRQDGGEWRVSAESAPRPTNSETNSGQSSSGSASASDNDVLKRLLEKREKESK